MNTLAATDTRAPQPAGRHRKAEPKAVSLAHPDLPRPLGQPAGRHRRPEPALATAPTPTPSAGRHHAPAAPRRVTSPALARPPRRAQEHRHPQRTRPSLRPVVSAGLAVVVSGAVVGAVSTPPPSAIRLTAVQQSAVVSSEPTPTPLLAALIGCPTPGECPDSILGTALGALFNFAAVAVNGALLAWDDIVNLGADFVANLALTPAALGVALSTGVNLTVQNLLVLLAPLAGPITAPLLDGIATVVADISAFVNVGVGGIGDAIAWKAQLDAVLADLVASGGVALVNGLTNGLLGLLGVVPGGLPDIDFADAAAALGVVVNHVAVGLDALMLGWGTAVNLGADIVGTIALSVADIGTAISGRVTDALLTGVAALADLAGPIAAPVFTGIANLVTGVSALINTAITIPTAALAWKAELDAVLADLAVNGGVALTNGLAGGLMGMVDAEPVGLPDIGFAEFCESLVTVVDHVTVGLAGVFTGDATVPAPTVDPLPEPDAATVSIGVTLPSTEPNSVVPQQSVVDPPEAGGSPADETPGAAAKEDQEKPSGPRKAGTQKSRDSQPKATADRTGPRHRAR